MNRDAMKAFLARHPVSFYDRTDSLFIGMLAHASLTACTLVMWPATAGVHLLAFDVSVSVVIWVTLATVAAVNGGRLSQRRLLLPLRNVGACSDVSSPERRIDQRSAQHASPG